MSKRAKENDKTLDQNTKNLKTDTEAVEKGKNTVKEKRDKSEQEEYNAPKRGGWYYRLSYQRKTGIWALIFLSPWLIGFFAFFAKSIVELVIYSFNDISLFRGGMDLSFVGLDNYRYIFTQHSSFNQLMITETVSSIPSLILIMIFSLIIAVVLNGKFKGRTFFRAIFFLPIIMATDILSTSIGGAAAGMIEQSQGDQLNTVGFIAGFITEMFNSPEITTGILTAVSNIFDTVLLSGVQTLIFLGGLQAINPSLYEVANIEGASGYETFWKVTLPMLSPMILTAAVYTLAEHFMNAEVVQLAYATAFTSGEYGYSAAMSLVFMIISVTVIAIVMWILSKGVYYYD